MRPSADEIADVFLAIPLREVIGGNWGLGDEGPWELSGGVYINGVPLLVDLDLRLGCLLEIVDRLTRLVSYLALATWPGGRAAAWWPGGSEPFAARGVGYGTISAWALEFIHAAYAAEREGRAASPPIPPA